jgi:hypothetical protein
MLIAHLPSGYLLGRAVRAKGMAMSAALVGSVFPDLDMLWFHLIDHGALHHHKYWVHAPGFWLILSAVALPLIFWRWRALTKPALIFLAAILLHLVLDSLGGGIMWAWPFSTQLFQLITVPATQSHWVLSFLLHWTFLAELAIISTAAVLYLRRP